MNITLMMMMMMVMVMMMKIDHDYEKLKNTFEKLPREMWNRYAESLVLFGNLYTETAMQIEKLNPEIIIALWNAFDRVIAADEIFRGFISQKIQSDDNTIAIRMRRDLIKSVITECLKDLVIEFPEVELLDSSIESLHFFTEFFSDKIDNIKEFDIGIVTELINHYGKELSFFKDIIQCAPNQQEADRVKKEFPKRFIEMGRIAREICLQNKIN